VSIQRQNFLNQVTTAFTSSEQISSLLAEAEYANAARLIGDLQRLSETSPNPLVTSLLMIARWLCLSSLRSRAEAEFYRQAAADASRQETELRELLYTLLESSSILATHVGDTPPRALQEITSRTMTPHDPERADEETLLHKTWNILGRALKHLQMADLSTINVAVSEPTPTHPEKEQNPLTAVARPPDPPIARLVIYCFGAFRVCRDNQFIANWKGSKGMSILKHLVVHRETPTPKDVLMDVFWPDLEPDAARRNLHQAIYSLRRDLRPANSDVQFIQFENDCYLLNPDLTVWVDAGEFEKRYRAGRDLEKAGRLAEALVEYSIAEGLYQSDFLQEDLYEDWIAQERTRLRAIYQTLADRLSEHYLKRAEYTAAMAVCHKMIALDDCNEQAYRRLMKCYYAQGQRHLAIRQYLSCIDALKKGLNLVPSAETVALYENMVGA
jgi:DNA-binding SARP family transcriptional activator